MTFSMMRSITFFYTRRVECIAYLKISHARKVAQMASAPTGRATRDQCVSVTEHVQARKGFEIARLAKKPRKDLHTANMLRIMECHHQGNELNKMRLQLYFYQ